MPGATTAAIFKQMSVELDLPIVSMFYDGTGNQNRRLEAFLHSALDRSGSRPQPPVARPERVAGLRPGVHPVRVFRSGEAASRGAEM
jgi:hypothetical protein